MGFVEAVQECLRKYATFTGRAGRSEFWWFVLFTILLGIVSSFFGQTVNTIVSLAVFVPSIAVGARRLHDIGKSGWFQLLWAIPFIGWALLIWWGVQPSGPANAYGTGPALPRDDPLGIPPGV